MTWVKNIQIVNFRRYNVKDIEFLPGINVIVGDNGAGKTSILEGIYGLGYKKSFRKVADKDLLCHNQDYFIFKGVVVLRDQREIEMFWGYTEGKSLLKRDGEVVKKLSENFKTLKIVHFNPSHVPIICASADTKRTYIDEMLCLIDTTYMATLKEYNKILQERNAYLKKSSVNWDDDGVVLELLSQKMVDVGGKLVDKRVENLALVNSLISLSYQKIADNSDTIKIEYLKNIDKKGFAAALASQQSKELIMGTSLVGPHRDNFAFVHCDNNSKCYSSQGEQKSILLAILCVIRDILHSRGEDLIILLDDAFGELDAQHQRRIIQLFKGSEQVIITTTQAEPLVSQGDSEVNIIKL
jgi:DNA replication and repair protein RecF